MKYPEWLEKTKRIHLELKKPLDVDSASATYINSGLLLKEFALQVDLVKH